MGWLLAIINVGFSLANASQNALRHDSLHFRSASDCDCWGLRLSLCPVSLLSFSHLTQIHPPLAHILRSDTQMQYKGLKGDFSLTIMYEYFTNDELFI